MIHEYALEPEMVAAWGSRRNSLFYFREFGLSQGRLVSRYPKNWVKKVWNAYSGGSEMDRKRLEEFLVLMKRSMVKRKNCCWSGANEDWLENALLEHARHPFQAILARNNPENRPSILTEDDLAESQCTGWDTPHGITVSRNAEEMAAKVERLLTLCKWVKFVDPYFSSANRKHGQALSAFLSIIRAERPVGPPEGIEIHTSGNAASMDHLKEFFERIIPTGLTITLFQWQEKPGGQKLHNRYILTDLGGVSFYHGPRCWSRR